MAFATEQFIRTEGKREREEKGERREKIDEIIVLMNLGDGHFGVDYFSSLTDSMFEVLHNSKKTNI